MKALKKLVNSFEIYAAAGCQFIMILVLALGVFSRYVLRASISWSEELALIFFVLSVYFGTTAAIRRNQHLRLTVVLDRLNAKSRLRLLIVDNFIFMLFNVVILGGLWQLTSSLYANGTLTAVLRIPKYLVYFFLPLMFVFMIIRLIQDCVDKMHEIKKLGETPDEQHTGTPSDL